jgi:hypothetical protein
VRECVSACVCNCLSEGSGQLELELEFEDFELRFFMNLKPTIAALDRQHTKPRNRQTTISPHHHHFSLFLMVGLFAGSLLGMFLSFLLGQ